MRGAMLLFVCLSALGAKRSAACSIDRSTILPTSYELVAMADLIVVAKTTTVSPGGVPQIFVEVVESLKGERPPPVGTELVVDGRVNPNAQRSARGELNKLRGGGRCYADDYALGRHYLLFFKRDAGSMNVLRVPLARINEEVDAQDDPWTIVVREYVRIGALPTEAARDLAFAALITKGHAAGASRTDKAIAADVEYHVMVPTPYKSLARLDAMYRTAASDKKGVYLLAIANKGEPASLPLMKTSVEGLIAGTLTDPYGTSITAVARYFERVPHREVVRRLATSYFARSPDDRKPWWPIFSLVMNQADASYSDLLEGAVHGATDEEVVRIAEWTMHYMNEAVRNELHRRVGARLRTAHVMMRQLAMSGDGSVVDWAKPHVAAPSPPEEPETRGVVIDIYSLPSDHDVAVEVIALSWHPKAAELVPSIIARGGQDLLTFIAASARNSHPIADTNLAAIAKHPGLSPRAKAAVARAIAARAERRTPAAKK